MSTVPSAQGPSQAELLDGLRAIVPPLNGDSYKGEHGKVGILGGCREYTGAPYFAAMAAIKVGADLSHVFCTASAAGPIKTYSPELIVLPFLPDGEDVERREGLYAEAQERIGRWLSRMGCLIAGPGLGDDPHVVQVSKQVIRAARELGVPLVMDGSALNFLAKEPDLVRGYSRCILTPNLMEFGRLAQGVGVQLEGSIGAHWQRHTPELAAAFGGPVILAKGPADVICHAAGSLECGQRASPKRSGGQGDVLTGAVAAFLCWARLHARKQAAPAPAGGGNGSSNGSSNGAAVAAAAAGAPSVSPMALAAYGGSLVTRTASLAAFRQQGRAMMAGDILPHLQPALQQWLPDDPAV